MFRIVLAVQFIAAIVIGIVTGPFDDDRGCDEDTEPHPATKKPADEAG